MGHRRWRRTAGWIDLCVTERAQPLQVGFAESIAASCQTHGNHEGKDDGDAKEVFGTDDRDGGEAEARTPMRRGAWRLTSGPERLPSCQARTAAKRYSTPTENPAAQKQISRVAAAGALHVEVGMECMELRSASTPQAGSDWRKPRVCPRAKKSSRTAVMRYSREAFTSCLQRTEGVYHPGAHRGVRPWRGVTCRTAERPRWRERGLSGSMRQTMHGLAKSRISGEERCGCRR